MHTGPSLAVLIAAVLTAFAVGALARPSGTRCIRRYGLAGNGAVAVGEGPYTKAW